MARSIALVSEKIAHAGHSLRLADLESPSGTEMRRVFLFWRSALIFLRLTHPEQNKVNRSTKALFFLAQIRHSDCGFTVSYSAWPSLAVDTVNGWMDACSSITTAAVYISIRRQTMWEPMCPRMQMPLTGRDGLCDGEQKLHAHWEGCDRLGERLIVFVIRNYIGPTLVSYV